MEQVAQVRVVTNFTNSLKTAPSEISLGLRGTVKVQRIVSVKQFDLSGVPRLTRDFCSPFAYSEVLYDFYFIRGHLIKCKISGKGHRSERAEAFGAIFAIPSLIYDRNISLPSYM